jgi:hypothetical protein
MAVSYNTVTVQSSSPTVIKAANNARRGIQIYNNGSVIVYVGPNASITASTGIPLLPQSLYETSGEHQAWRGAIYGLAASVTADVRFFEWEN